MQAMYGFIQFQMRCLACILFLADTACRTEPAKLGHNDLHAPKVEIVKSGGMLLSGFFDRLPASRRLPDVTTLARQAVSCREPSIWSRWMERIGLSGVVHAQNTCVEAPCVGRYVRLVPGPCGGPCFGNYNAGFTNGPENVGLTEKNYTVCWGGNNGVGGGCPCQKHECNNAP